MGHEATMGQFDRESARAAGKAPSIPRLGVARLHDGPEVEPC